MGAGIEVMVLLIVEVTVTLSHVLSTPTATIGNTAVTVATHTNSIPTRSHRLDHHTLRTHMATTVQVVGLKTILGLMDHLPEDLFLQEVGRPATIHMARSMVGMAAALMGIMVDMEANLLLLIGMDIPEVTVHSIALHEGGDEVDGKSKDLGVDELLVVT